MSEFLKRLSYLKSILNAKSHTSSELLEMLEQKNFLVSQRQIQRDLKSLESILTDDELLNSYYEEGRKYFFIKTQHLDHHHESPDSNFTNARQTKFYHQHLDEQKTETLALLDKAIHQKNTIDILLVRDDETGDNLELDSFKFTVCPIELIYHRASYYLGCYNLKKNSIEIFGIRQLEDLKINSSYTNFKKYKKLLDNELNKRFGVTKNINDIVYKIKLEFTSATGRFVQDHHWHPSQSIIKINGNYVMTLECGINRELLGWLFLWMYNVKVIEPPILKDLYKKALSACESTINEETPFVYKNIFYN